METGIEQKYTRHARNVRVSSNSLRIPAKLATRSGKCWPVLGGVGPVLRVYSVGCTGVGRIWQDLAHRFSRDRDRTRGPAPETF